MRGRVGCVILITSCLALALFHWAAPATYVGDKDLRQINLPMPTNEGTLPQVDPTGPSAPSVDETYHASRSCNLAYINAANYDREMFFSQGTVIGLSGWVVDIVNKNVPAKTWMVFVNTESGARYQSPITFWMDRDDVREVFGGKEAYARAGFISNVKTDHLLPGRYHLYIKYEAKSIFYTCDNGRYMKIGTENHE